MPALSVSNEIKAAFAKLAEGYFEKPEHALTAIKLRVSRMKISLNSTNVSDESLRKLIRQVTFNLALGDRNLKHFVTYAEALARVELRNQGSIEDITTVLVDKLGDEARDMINTLRATAVREEPSVPATRRPAPAFATAGAGTA